MTLPSDIHAANCDAVPATCTGQSPAERPRLAISDILPDSRRAELAVQRRLVRAFGKALAGRLLILLSKLRIARSHQKVYYVLSANPPILYLGNVMRHVFEIGELLRDHRVCFVKNAYYTYEKPERICELSAQTDLFKRTYPQHRIHFVCATQQELSLFQEAGIAPATFMNKNALVDERMFVIDPAVEKRFDAIYNAQIWPGKRHELAAGIHNLALLGYRDARIKNEIGSYGEMVTSVLPHATWLNSGAGQVPPREVPALLNQARVGLCLSSEEGPMAASIEYMLCGLPVVSTRSLGGRDVFFDHEYVRVVEDTPAAVAEGVRELIGRNIPATYIREKTLKKIAVHRDRFIAIIDALLKKSGCSYGFREDFERIRINKLRAAAPFPGGFLVHLARGMPIELCRRIGEESII